MINYQYQKGQAFAEYVVMIPAAIMIMIGASLVTGFIVTSLGKSVDALQPYGVEVCDAMPEVVPEVREGPTYTEAGYHEIELCGVFYNEADNTTTVSYCVTSAACPSISHWTLGLPADVAANVIETNDPTWSYGTDPTTGVTGIKFDTGYEGVDNAGVCGGGNGNNGNNGNTQFGNNGVGNGEDGQPPGNPPVNDGEGTSPGNPGNQNGGGNGGNNDNQNGNNGVGNGEDPQPPGNPPVNDGEGSSPGNPGNQNGNGNNGNNGNGNGNGNKKLAATYARSQTGDEIDGVSRTVILLVTGQYDFGPIETAVKAGQEVDYVSISAPVRAYDASLNWECE